MNGFGLELEAPTGAGENMDVQAGNPPELWRGALSVVSHVAIIRCVDCRFGDCCKAACDELGISEQPHIISVPGGIHLLAEPEDGPDLMDIGKRRRLCDSARTIAEYGFELLDHVTHCIIIPHEKCKHVSHTGYKFSDFKQERQWHLANSRKSGQWLKDNHPNVRFFSCFGFMSEPGRPAVRDVFEI